MKYMVTWNVSPENYERAMARFKNEDPKPGPEVETLGRWIEIGGMQGFSLFETNDPAAFWKFATKWADLLETQVVPVLTDAEMASAL
jgi:hypothetical protein